MNLTGSQTRQIVEALLSAFPSRSALALMLRFHLNLRLDRIATGENLQDIVFRLLEWAEANNQVSLLIEGAVKENPNNSKLQELAVSYIGWQGNATIANQNNRLEQVAITSPIEEIISTPQVKRESPKAKGHFLFGRTVVCYHCLTKVRGNNIFKCRSCGKKISSMYIEHYNVAPPLFLQLIGKSGAGKSTYLAVLLALISKMAKYWNKYGYQALAPETDELIQRAARVVTFSQLENATDPYADLPICVLELANMPRWENRSLIIRDIAGEIFLRPQEFSWTIDKDKAPHMLGAPTSLLLLDLEELNHPDFDKDLGQTLQRLVQNYVGTLTENNMSPSEYPRNMVVVLTKADVMQNELPNNLKDYIFNDKTWVNAHTFSKSTEEWNEAFMREYINALEKVSETIKDWISGDAGVLGAIRTAERNHLKLKFSIISSTGFPVNKEDNTVDIGIEARRIIDPLFWALELNS